MKKYSELPSNPIKVLLLLLGAKWKLLIIYELLKKEMRFVELKKKLNCTGKILTSCLKELENDGFIIREKDDSNFNKVEYYLTDIGYTLRPVIESIYKWGKDYKKLRKLMEKYSETE